MKNLVIISIVFFLLQSCIPLDVSRYKTGVVSKIEVEEEYYTVYIKITDKKFLQVEERIINYNVGDSVNIKSICSPERQYIKVTKK
jgi:hypothetical protein